MLELKQWWDFLLQSFDFQVKRRRSTEVRGLVQGDTVSLCQKRELEFFLHTPLLSVVGGLS